MKKFLVGLVLIFGCSLAIAHTINWRVGDQIISTTTCDSGDNITPPTPPVKYGYTFYVWERPYTRLEYLESSGTQWIDTGIVPTVDYSIEVKAIKQTGRSLFGAIGYNLTGGGMNYWYLGVDAPTYPNTIDNSVVHVWGYDANRREIYCDDVFIGTTPGSGGISGSIYLFNRSQLNDGGAHKIYYVKIWDENNVLVRNMIPVKRDGDNVLGMYDMVSGTLFTNGGSGNFIAGPEVGAVGAE